MKILITGGHFSPAYAAYEAICERGHTAAFVTRRHAFEADITESFEYKTLQEKGIKFFELKTGRIQRKFSTHTIPSIAKIPSGVLAARRILKEYKPDVVLTFGGYLAFPVSYAAFILGIPVVMHEQTQKAGLASKLIAPIASKICISYESSREFFPQNKTVLTGNPIREEVFKIKKTIKIPEGKVIYITGGSTGSHFINTLISQILAELLKDYVLIHQTGDSHFGDFEKLSDLREKLHEKLRNKYILHKFISPAEIGSVFAKSDLILSRSGANSISEILATRRVSLLIPLSHGQKNEQLENAKLVKNLGVGEYLEESGITPLGLLDQIKSIFKNYDDYLNNFKKIAKEPDRDAGNRLIDVIEKQIQK